MPLTEAVYENLYIVTRDNAEVPRRSEQLLGEFRLQRRNTLYGYADAPESFDNMDFDSMV